MSRHQINSRLLKYGIECAAALALVAVIIMSPAVPK
jgi:hypothetical protein